jgi:hypothetical protein
MTKLEQKLIELGYELNYEKQESNLCGVWIYRDYLKPCNKYFHLEIVYEIQTNSKTYTLFPIKEPKFIWQISKYTKLREQAFNQLQNDLKELKEYEQH